ncbi:hypothetical protein Gpo141_00008023 [Globisporangium polare]
MKYWTHKAASSTAAAASAAAMVRTAKAPVEDQFKTLVEITIQELTSARRELAAAVEEAKKMRAASAPSMPTQGGSTRCRSLSSTWGTTDSDDEGDDESDVEEYDDDDESMLLPKEERAAIRKAQRRSLFMLDGGAASCDYDDDTEHEEARDAFPDLAHGKDVASLARAASTNTLPILNRITGGRTSSSRASGGGEEEVDVTTATYPSALPAVRVSGRRRSNSRNSRSRRRRTRSESAASGISSSNNNNSSGNNCSSSPTQNHRLRILLPNASKIYFSGWVRGQPADVRWEVLDKSVEFVRIDVCNKEWNEPTVIARHEPNDGRFEWRKVVWGLPIMGGYYVNIYDATHPEEVYEDAKLPLLTQSEPFAVVG